MRRRNKKNADKRLAECGGYFIDSAALNLSAPSVFFGNSNPVYLEIGCGKGGFASKMAKKHPGVNFIAVESNKNVMVLAAEKACRDNIENLKFVLGDARALSQQFCENSFDRIYLNFSDPWPKARHEKRRLTHKDFLEMYRRLLKPGGKIQFKTDNTGLFDYSVDSLSENGFVLESVTRDLHADADPDNVMTEYEELFSSQGSKICRVIARDK